MDLSCPHYTRFEHPTSKLNAKGIRILLQEYMDPLPDLDSSRYESSIQLWLLYESGYISGSGGQNDREEERAHTHMDLEFGDELII